MDPGQPIPPNTAGYNHEKTILVGALQALVGNLPGIVTEESQRVLGEVIASSPPVARLDLGHHYAERVYARAFARHYGLPLDDPDNPLTSRYFGTPPGEHTLMRFIRTLGATIGSGHPAPFGLEKKAVSAGREFRSFLIRAIERHDNGSRVQSAQTIVGYLCAQKHQFVDGLHGIARCVAGMLSAGASFSRLFASIVDVLLKHGQLGAFKAAVERDDTPRVRAYILEALRFRPPFPMLVRSCPAAKELSGATEQQNVKFAANSMVIFLPLEAMFDPACVTQPDDFLADRPEQIYMHFGRAPRECIGKPSIEQFFLPMFRVLFEHAPGLVNAKPGKFRFDSVALDTYYIGPVELVR
jgi:cytochrome P450